MNNRSLCIYFFLILEATVNAAGSLNYPEEEIPFAEESFILEQPYAAEEVSSDLYFLQVRRNEGETIGDKISYTTLEAFSFPCNYRNLYPFADLRYHGFGESAQNAVNAGIGLRVAPRCTKYVFGANIYYDYRNVYHRSFNQLGIGLESLGPCINFRFNAYLPVGKKSRLLSSDYCAKYSGERFLIKERFVDSLKGVDFEAEMRAARICCTDIYFAIGGYYYKRKACGRDILGSEYRITVNPCRWLSFSVMATYDCHYRTRVQGEITLTFPFHCKGDADACSIQFQPVRRREMIVVDKHNMFLWNW